MSFFAKVFFVGRGQVVDHLVFDCRYFDPLNKYSRSKYSRPTLRWVKSSRKLKGVGPKNVHGKEVILTGLNTIKLTCISANTFYFYRHFWNSCSCNFLKGAQIVLSSCKAAPIS